MVKGKGSGGKNRGGSRPSYPQTSLQNCRQVWQG